MIFLNEDDPLFRRDDRTIVDAFTLAAVIRHHSDGKDKDEPCLLDCVSCFSRNWRVGPSELHL